VRQKIGIDRERIPDYLALVGDSTDRFPGVAGIGAAAAARLVNRHGPLEDFLHMVFRGNREQALLLKVLAPLREEEPLFSGVDEIRWPGPRDGFGEVPRQLGDPKLVHRCARVLERQASGPEMHG
jgi:5'-3' exonuclease